MMDSTHTNIVIVDDDNIVISSLKNLFELEEIKGVVYFNNPFEALKFIESNKPKVVISDFLMPEINGIDFLSKVKNMYNDEISLILLTGYADKENAIRAINELGLYRYIEKPWDNNDLIINIKNAIEKSDLVSQLKQKVTELELAKEQLKKYSVSLENQVKERTLDLDQINQKLKAIIDNCADGIVLIDEQGYIESANFAFENLLGLGLNLILSQNIQKFVNSDKSLDILSCLKSDKDVFLSDFYTINLINNHKIPLEISFAPIINQAKINFVGVIRNISAQKEMERLRDDFIATLTHDLRTPLLAAIQTLQYFIDGTLGNLSDKQLKFLKTMKISNEDMLGLVNALLEVYRYESGKLNLAKTSFNLNEFLEQCANEIQSLALQKNIKFSLITSSTENINIFADRNELRRVIINLCGNAIKYTSSENGMVELSSSIYDDTIQISVKDNGQGIPSCDIPKMFKRFSQGTSKKRSTGVGLGLYLSRQIIEAHEGKIWVESNNMQGSTFSFILKHSIVEDNDNNILDKNTLLHSVAKDFK